MPCFTLPKSFKKDGIEHFVQNNLEDMSEEKDILLLGALTAFRKNDQKRGYS